MNETELIKHLQMSLRREIKLQAEVEVHRDILAAILQRQPITGFAPEDIARITENKRESFEEFYRGLPTFAALFDQGSDSTPPDL